MKHSASCLGFICTCKLDRAKTALTEIATSETPTELAEDLGVNPHELQVKGLKLIAKEALKEIGRH